MRINMLSLEKSVLVAEITVKIMRHFIIIPLFYGDLMVLSRCGEKNDQKD
jgi:hypothetical protein